MVFRVILDQPRQVTFQVGGAGASQGILLRDGVQHLVQKLRARRFPVTGLYLFHQGDRFRHQPYHGLSAQRYRILLEVEVRHTHAASVALAAHHHLVRLQVAQEHRAQTLALLLIHSNVVG